jgi:hypothetical protein
LLVEQRQRRGLVVDVASASIPSALMSADMPPVMPLNRSDAAPPKSLNVSLLNEPPEPPRNEVENRFGMSSSPRAELQQCGDPWGGLNAVCLRAREAGAVERNISRFHLHCGGPWRLRNLVHTFSQGHVFRVFVKSRG